jgi:hypothetical protein
VKTDQIFWGIWAVVVLAAGAVYLFVVSPMRDENRKLLREKQFLAARFLPLEETKRIQRVCAKSKADRARFKLTKVKLQDGDAEQKRPFDTKLWKLYPLSRNLARIPNRNFVDGKRDEDKALSAARRKFEAKLSKHNFAVNPKTDFKPVPPPFDKDANMTMERLLSSTSAVREGDKARFREWVDKEDKQIDATFQAAAKDCFFKPQTADLLNPNNRGLRWLDDGRVTGFINESGHMAVVLKRLMLRRQILMAVARAKAVVQRLKKINGGARESANPEPRGVERVIRLYFDRRYGAPAPKRVPYKPEKVELTVSCHLAVVPALLRQLEAIGAKRDPGSERLEQVRPFAFWVHEVRIKRPAGWPEATHSVGEVNSELAGSYGRYLEWPVTVFISGVVPEFDPKNDPEPKRKPRKKGKK